MEGHNVTVCVQNDTFEKIKVPEWLRRALKDYMDTFDNQEPNSTNEMPDPPIHAFSGQTPPKFHLIVN